MNRRCLEETLVARQAASDDRWRPDGTSARGALFISGLLVVAWAVVDAALGVAIASRELYRPAVLSVLGIGAALGQVALLASWLVWSQQSLGVRIGTCAVCLSGLAGLAAVSTSDPWNVWLAVQMSQFACIAPAFVILRLCGFSLRLDTHQTPRPGRAPLRAGQFSIGAIMSIFTGCAVLLALLRLMEIPWNARGTVVLLCLAVSANALVSFYLAFRWPNRALRWLVTGAAACLIGMLLRNTGDFARNHAPLVLICLIQSVALSGSVSTLRVAGWQLRVER
jgi:hypothetical protein